MGVAELGRRRRFAPPPHARIDWSHPLAQGLAFCYVPSVGLVDLASGCRGSDTGTVPSPTPFGRGALSAASSQYATFPGRSDSPFLGRITFEWAGTLRVGSRYHHFAGKHSGSGGVNTPFDFRTSNESVPRIHLVRGNGSTFTTFQSSSNLPLGVPHHVAVTTDLTTVKFYIDGASGGSTADSIGTATGSNADIVVGQRPDGATVSLDGVAVLCRVWSRELSAADIASLYADPFQMLVW